MAKEIERKYRVVNDSWRNLVTKKSKIIQAYLLTELKKTIRVRIADDKAFLTIKGKTEGISRDEFEYQIPLEDAQLMIQNYCENIPIEKYRHFIVFDGLEWTIDEFLGKNEGLIMAEVELKTENQVLVIPKWIGEELSFDSRFFNSYLSKKPYSEW